MKRYRELENGIEYEVFEFDNSEQDYEPRIIDSFEHSKILRVYSDHKNVYYFKKGEAHNDYGPAMITQSTGNIYYRFGDLLKDEEWKVYYRTLMADRMLNGDAFPPKNDSKVK